MNEISWICLNKTNKHLKHMSLKKKKKRKHVVQEQTPEYKVLSDRRK